MASNVESRSVKRRFEIKVDPPKLAVVGGGIMGVSSALMIMELMPFFKVTIISEKFSPDTASDAAAGIFYPYHTKDVNPLRFRYWSRMTFDYLLDIFNSPHAGACGVGLLSAYHLSDKPLKQDIYGDLFLNKREMTQKELDIFPDEYKYGEHFTTIYAECSKLMSAMMARYKEKGGEVQRRKVNSLIELMGTYAIVINCTGVGAKKFVPDSDVYPVRGQTIRVNAPWIKHGIITDKFYIMPNSDVVVCGGTFQPNDSVTTVRTTDKNRIWADCCQVLPSLKNSKFVKDRVGINPGRSKPRLEEEFIMEKDGQKMLVIHNYGHNISGTTVFWGCARDVVDILMRFCKRGQL